MSTQSTAIERITGFACEVDQEKWKELVKVADEVGCPIGTASRSVRQPTENWACYNSLVKCLGVYTEKFTDCKPTTYPDFLAKLKGDEKWEPKNGEEVEVKVSSTQWATATYIGPFGDYFVCKGRFEYGSFGTFKAGQIRPLRSTITRKEAEEKLNARIID